MIMEELPDAVNLQADMVQVFNEDKNVYIDEVTWSADPLTTDPAGEQWMNVTSLNLIG